MRVLVVDDDADTVDSTELLLKLNGHQIETAKDGVHAIERAAVFRPDLVLLDLAMPTLDGLAVARRIQGIALSPKPYLVAVSGYATAEDKRHCAEAGFDLHLTKPVDAGVFEGLTDLVRSTDDAWISRPYTLPSQLVVMDLMVQQVAMGNLALNTVALGVSRELASRCIAKADEAHGRVTVWLNRGGCPAGRVDSMMKALSALRERAFSCKQKLLTGP